ncbi:MAG: glycoside hydrolase family 127 protein [Acidobacteria bacterium]|nr:glycoside hydrolase family 127 protein [Acidobacteriota bacterium]
MKLALSFVLCSCAVFAQPWKDRPVLDTAASPKAVLQGVPVSAVRVEDGFWSPRRKVNVEVSLPTLLLLFEEKGILDNFRRISGRKQVSRRGPLFTDSDVYKWLEAVGFVLQSEKAPELRAKAEAVIDEIVAAQEESGYLNTFYSAEGSKQRHTNMRGGHELYCLGHMVQAGIAWYRGTGDAKLLDSSRKMVEYLIREFGPGRKAIYEGHPEIELALIELYRLSGDKRYLEFAQYLLNGDPRNMAATSPRDRVYLFTVRPFTERTKLEGHAVRAMYACSGATDYYLETGDTAYWKTLATLWDDMAQRKIYLTGGVGSRASGEAFGEPYELPNQQAYTESCAAIGTMFWNWRMLQATGDAKYMDLFERALYNGANSGLSLAGNLYCYRNPLELTGNPEDRIRNPWYDTTCCPPNLQRVMASLPGYFYSTSKDGLWVHLYDNNTLTWKVNDKPVVWKQTTRYPWEGKVELSLQSGGGDFTLYLRRPAWAETASVRVDGKSITPELRNGYMTIRKSWKAGDRVTLDFPMRERLTVANTRVRENLGKFAVERGPLVYCMEGLDQPSGASLFDWELDSRAKFTSEWKPEMLGGVTILKHAATRPSKASGDLPLYRDLSAAPAKPVPGTVTLIPYYTFHNRDITPMQVWIPLK